jgi:6-phosphogluconolactonase (cycloisomerase 2 family)
MKKFFFHNLIWCTLICTEIIFNPCLHGNSKQQDEMTRNKSVTTHMISDGAVTMPKLHPRLRHKIKNLHNGNSANFTGSLSGDVQGTQDATSVTCVGGQSSSAVAAAALAVAGATPTNTPNTLVLRDDTGSFQLQEIDAELLGSIFNPTIVDGTPLTSTITTPNNFLFTPNNQFLMVLNSGAAGTVSIFSVDQVEGTLTAIDGSPFSFSDIADHPWDFTISPNGGFIAVSMPTHATIVILRFIPSIGYLFESNASPFSTGDSKYALAFSPNGKFLAATNESNHTIAIYTVDQSNGALDEVSGSPFAAHAPHTIKFSPNGNYLAAVDTNIGKTSIYAFDNTTGALSEITGSPYTVGAGDSPSPFYATFSPDGQWYAVSNTGDYSVDMFSMNPGTGALNFLSRTFAYLPEEISFSPDSQFLVTSGLGQPPHGNISFYSVNPNNGTLTGVSNFTGFDAGCYPYRIAFTPNGNFLAILDASNGKVSMLSQVSSEVMIRDGISINGNLVLPATSSTGGVITLGSRHFIHNAGVDNTYIGEGAGNLSVVGAYNVGVGTNALQSATSGWNNIAVGANAGTSLTDGENNIYIGADAGTATESSAIRIGGSDNLTCYIGGVYSGEVGSGVTVMVNSYGQLGLAPSSERYKDNIKDMNNITEKLMALHPVSFTYKNDAAQLTQYGLLAEEVAKILPELVAYNNDGTAQTVRYHELSSLLLHEYQQQEKKIQELEEKFEKLSKNQ